MLPRLPDRHALLNFLRRPQQSVSHYDIRNETDSEDLTPEPICDWLTVVYGLTDVVADGWFEYDGTVSRGVTIRLSAEEQPSVRAYLHSLQIASNTLDSLLRDEYDGTVSREELIHMLEHWERPHEAAEEIARQRHLD